MFGLFAPCPIRLTAVDPVHGWSASQHARICSDVVAGWRTLPLAVMTVQVNASSVELISYNGRNGSGSEHAPTLTYANAIQPCFASWDNAYENEFEEFESWAIRHGKASIEYSGSKKDTCITQTLSSVNSVSVLVEGTPTTPYYITIVVYGSWGKDRQIGNYGGDLSKKDNITEAFEPYAAQWYREIRSNRGSAYTDKPLTLVDYENVALSRYFSAIFSRTPEKYSANALPGNSTERLNYWVNALGIPHNSDEPDWILRQRAAAHYKAALGPTLSNVTAAVSDLLGSAFVDIQTYHDGDLENPPSPTFWPSGDVGDPSYSIGGYTWLSRRAHIRINVTDPPGMPQSDFLQLMNVQLHQLLDRMLPAWVTWNWSVGSDGFIIGIDKIGIDAL